MRAGIYEAKKIVDCPFEFEMLDDTKQFGTPFIVNKILLNHPAIEQTNCDATAFVLEATALEFNKNQFFPTSQIAGNSLYLQEKLSTLK
ncbi:MAG: hypothetical protein U5L09_15120 [Bacteroidales bacterium]|nr:hypothetical protein [Bacteroidales bacterium]